jgi:hypothetical protein
MIIFLLRKIFSRKDRYPLSDERDMIKIKCVNKECTAPDRIFEFDEFLFGATGPGNENEIGSQPFLIECPFCHTNNLVWLKRPGLTKQCSLQADIILVKDEPLDFR